MDMKTKKFIVNELRRATIRWDGRKNALKSARRKVIDETGKAKLHWQCAKCGLWSRDQKTMEVDHIIEVGEVEKSELIDLINRMYDASNLQVLCQGCHRKKTAVFNSMLLYQRKKRPL